MKKIEKVLSLAIIGAYILVGISFFPANSDVGQGAPVGRLDSGERGEVEIDKSFTATSSLDRLVRCTELYKNIQILKQELDKPLTRLRTYELIDTVKLQSELDGVITSFNSNC